MLGIELQIHRLHFFFADAFELFSFESDIMWLVTLSGICQRKVRNQPFLYSYKWQIQDFSKGGAQIRKFVQGLIMQKEIWCNHNLRI